MPVEQEKGTMAKHGKPERLCAAFLCKQGDSERARIPNHASASASPKPHPSKPHACNMPQAKMEVALQFSESCAAEVAPQHSLFCSAEVIFTNNWAAASEKLQCNSGKAALQESGAFLPLSCGFQAPKFRHPRLGPDCNGATTPRSKEYPRLSSSNPLAQTSDAL